MGELQNRDKQVERAAMQHVIPFVGWIVILSLLTPVSGVNYAIRAVMGLGLFIWLRPWRYYQSIRLKHLPLALGVGVLVFVVWILPETETATRWPGVVHAYRVLGLLPPWRLTEPLAATEYAPEVCGWTLAIVRLLGSAIVIACIEEFFWRGFLYRLFAGRNFLKVDLGVMKPAAFCGVALLFGLEHTRWLAGIVAGIAYGYLMIRTRDIWATCFAHGITNFLLGLYVLMTGSYEFW
jgi:CAAX prenyl protease-like protein